MANLNNPKIRKGPSYGEYDMNILSPVIEKSAALIPIHLQIKSAHILSLPRSWRFAPWGSRRLGRRAAYR